MFGKWFGKTASAQHQDDQVWKTAAACRSGIRAQAVSASAAGRSVVVVCLSSAAFDVLDTALASLQPAHCRDLFGRDALRARIAQPGAITIALSGSLPTDHGAAKAPVEILVYGRHASRAADDAISRFADQLGAQTTIAFHLSLEDALLKPFVDSSMPLMEKLGIHEHEALSHAFITRAIRNCQSP